WDIRRPEHPFGDKFILIAGHTTPLIYATLAVFNEALRNKHKETSDAKYSVPDAESRQLVWEDLLTLRRSGGLPGHAESDGKTLFYKVNTGPSGHGGPPSVGQAVALKHAGAKGVRVFAFEGEGGLTAGASHESKNSAWGLGAGNLIWVVDWNDYGIDDQTISSVVHGTPEDWFKPYGWNVYGTENGSEWEHVTKALLSAVNDEDEQTPKMVWVKTRKGRGYLKYDNKSHGAPHPVNHELFWQTLNPLKEKYGIEFIGEGDALPESQELLREQASENLERMFNLFNQDKELRDYLADRLVEIGDSLPEDLKLNFRTDENPDEDPELTDFENYPEEMYLKPGKIAANRAGLAKWGAYANALSKKNYDRPLFLAVSADLADSTNISGFAKGWGEFEGYGRYEKNDNPGGALLPQEITEFTNSGIIAGIASVNFSSKPFEKYIGYFGTCSTYGSFSYLKYGPMRLFSQMVQDSPIKMGKVLWIAGHSGLETADDSRTHFGIFATGVTKLFPKGQVIDLHPWEHNEVPVVLGAALKCDAHIIALHLTRPGVEIPDRDALGMDSHFAAARGAYLIREYDTDKPKKGVVVIRGTITTANLIKALPRLRQEDINVKILSATSLELFNLQSDEYKEKIFSASDRADSMIITNGAIGNMSDWSGGAITEEYSLSADFDNRWRTGGTLEEVVEEAHLS
ncbi:MAG: transketolase, partial [Candidatus Marinimicrobia bacterium]|nr:transketolase [Candidatus Neomarinimicrobiota bacterium]